MSPAPRRGDFWRWRVVNKEILKKSAEAHFRARIRDTVLWIADKCWVSNIDFKLEDLNKIITVGQEFGITQAVTFSKIQISELVKDLSQLRTLDMKAEAREYICKKLIEQYLESSILDDLPPIEKS